MTNTLDKENPEWKEEFFKLYATESNNKESIQKADEIKFKKFPPVLGAYYHNNITQDELEQLLSGTIKVTKSKETKNYNPEILDTDYEKTIKIQLNMLMEDQIKRLDEEMKRLREESKDDKPETVEKLTINPEKNEVIIDAKPEYTLKNEEFITIPVTDKEGNKINETLPVKLKIGDTNVLTKTINSNIKIPTDKLATGDHSIVINIEEHENYNPSNTIIKVNQNSFFTIDEMKTIKNADFPFIKLMTLVYSKDTNKMSESEKQEWKANMNQFITSQIVFGVVNTHYAIKLSENGIYKTVFETPYNKKEVWTKYGYNQEGICLTYDFKEISPEMARRVQNMYPILYTSNKLTKDEIPYQVDNILCSSMLAVDSNINEKYDKQWAYILQHKFSNTEFMMLDSLVEPLYRKTLEDKEIKKIESEDYFETLDGELIYNYKKVIAELTNFLKSDNLNNKIKKELKDVYNILPEDETIEFMKPEALYLGANFPEDKKELFKTIAKANNVRILQIKEDPEKGLFKANLN